MPKAEKKEKPEKKEKKVKDPNAPKRPLAAYMFFCKEKREEIKKEDETLKFGAIGKLLGERWKVVEEGEKAVCVPCARTSSPSFRTVGPPEGVCSVSGEPHVGASTWLATRRSHETDAVLCAPTDRGPRVLRASTL